MLLRYHNHAHSPRCDTWFALEARLWFCWRFVVMEELRFRGLPVLAVPPLLCSPFRLPSLSPLALYLSSAHRNDRSRCRWAGSSFPVKWRSREAIEYLEWSASWMAMPHHTFHSSTLAFHATNEDTLRENSSHISWVVISDRIHTKNRAWNMLSAIVAAMEGALNGELLPKRVWAVSSIVICKHRLYVVRGEKKGDRAIVLEDIFIPSVLLHFGCQLHWKVALNGENLFTELCMFFDFINFFRLDSEDQSQVVHELLFGGGEKLEHKRGKRADNWYIPSNSSVCHSPQD